MKISQAAKTVSRKRRKLSQGKKSNSLNLPKKSGSVKDKRKLSNKKIPHKKKIKQERGGGKDAGTFFVAR